MQIFFIPPFFRTLQSNTTSITRNRTNTIKLIIDMIKGNKQKDIHNIRYIVVGNGDQM